MGELICYGFIPKEAGTYVPRQADYKPLDLHNSQPPGNVDETLLLTIFGLCWKEFIGHLDSKTTSIVRKIFQFRFKACD